MVGERVGSPQDRLNDKLEYGAAVVFPCGGLDRLTVVEGLSSGDILAP
jgi:hypothetical protein